MTFTEDISLEKKYEIYTSTLISLENRRQLLINIYVLILSGFSVFLFDESNNSNKLPPSFAIIFVSIVWILKLKYIRALTKYKYDVIKKLEEKMVLRPFELEWELFQEERKKYRGVGLQILEFSLPLLGLFFGSFTIISGCVQCK